MGQGVAACSAPCKCDGSLAMSTGIFASSTGSATRCICGNTFVADAVYCRKCGRKRPSAAELPPDATLAAWIRKRHGVDADFGDVFVELFGSRNGICSREFVDVLQVHGYSDGQAAFAMIDQHTNIGIVGATGWELLQVEIEGREAEALRHLRSFLKEHFSGPAAAFRQMGKGQGDVLCEAEFADAMQRLGFAAEDPLRLFHFLDKDYSGEICFAEFKAAMRNAVAPKKGKEEKAVSRSGSKVATVARSQPATSRSRTPSPSKSLSPGSKSLSPGGLRQGGDGARRSTSPSVRKQGSSIARQRTREDSALKRPQSDKASKSQKPDKGAAR